MIVGGAVWGVRRRRGRSPLPHAFSYYFSSLSISSLKTSRPNVLFGFVGGAVWGDAERFGLIVGGALRGAGTRRGRSSLPHASSSFSFSSCSFSSLLLASLKVL